MLTFGIIAKDVAGLLASIGFIHPISLDVMTLLDHVMSVNVYTKKERWIIMQRVQWHWLQLDVIRGYGTLAIL